METEITYLYFSGTTEKVFNGLSEDVEVVMPVKKAFWTEKYGLFKDQFGVQWLINYAEEAIS